MTKLFPAVGRTLPSGSGVSLNLRFRLYSSKPTFDIIPAMGRLRIKKKDAVLPFRQTMAYRLLLAAASVLLLIVTVYFFVHYVQSRSNTGMIVSVVGAVMAGTSLFYNLGEVRNAKVP